MNKDFNYHKLRWYHKKRYIIHQLVLMLLLIIVIVLAVNQTNPVLEETTDKMDVTLSGMLAVFIAILAVTNRLKQIFRLKFLWFLTGWLILSGMYSIMETLIWGLGASWVILAFDDIIMRAYWNRVWYNEYDR